MIESTFLKYEEFKVLEILMNLILQNENLNADLSKKSEETLAAAAKKWAAERERLMER